jgi:hypothetical protein
MPVIDEYDPSPVPALIFLTPLMFDWRTIHVKQSLIGRIRELANIGRRFQSGTRRVRDGAQHTHDR